MSSYIHDDKDNDYNSAHTDNDGDTIDKLSSWTFDNSALDKEFIDYNESLNSNFLTNSNTKNYFANASSFDTLLTEMDNEDITYQNFLGIKNNHDYLSEEVASPAVDELTLQRQQQQFLQYQRAQAKKLQLEIEIRELCAQNGGLPPAIGGGFLHSSSASSSVASPISVSRSLSNNSNKNFGATDLYGQPSGSVKKGPSEAELAAFRQQIHNQQQQSQPFGGGAGGVQQMNGSHYGGRSQFVNGRFDQQQSLSSLLPGFGQNSHRSVQQPQQNYFNKGLLSQQSYGGTAPHPPRQMGSTMQLGHGQSLMGGAMQPSPTPASYNGAVYQVQFKQAYRDYILGPRAPPTVAVGDFVMVECDRGEDLGVVTGVCTMSEFVERRYRTKMSLEDEASEVGRIIRHATLFERQQLPEKYHDEQNVFQVTCQLSAHTFKLPMRVVDAEYRFDRKKLTVYYVSDMRIDFRELVRDLFSAYRTRIWMKKVSLTGPLAFVPQDFAAMSLSSGVHFGAGSTTNSSVGAPSSKWPAAVGRRNDDDIIQIQQQHSSGR